MKKLYILLVTQVSFGGNILIKTLLATISFSILWYCFVIASGEIKYKFHISVILLFLFDSHTLTVDGWYTPIFKIKGYVV